MAHATIRLIQSLEDGGDDGLHCTMLPGAENGLHQESGDHRIPTKVGQKSPGPGQQLARVGEER